ncbi:recombinase family protein [Sorangium sp. So ce542]|uniref:recombinase family protein n=1 Tax=Sorangium sp. So ce542 TaxID=3133316 RepID=UPI003F634301
MTRQERQAENKIFASLAPWQHGLNSSGGLRSRVRPAGHHAPAERRVLIRPALERLRDRIAEGAIDVLYVHSPDRLARRSAYQVLLLEEFSARGVSVALL